TSSAAPPRTTPTKVSHHEIRGKKSLASHPRDHRTLAATANAMDSNAAIPIASRSDSDGSGNPARTALTELRTNQPAKMVTTSAISNRAVGLGSGSCKDFVAPKDRVKPARRWRWSPSTRHVPARRVGRRVRHANLCQLGENLVHLFAREG